MKLEGPLGLYSAKPPRRANIPRPKNRGANELELCFSIS